MLEEDWVPLIEAAALVPSRPHIATLHRWSTRGVRGVTLRTVLIGGKRYTSREAIEEFIEATSRAARLPAVAHGRGAEELAGGRLVSAVPGEESAAAQQPMKKKIDLQRLKLKKLLRDRKPTLRNAS